MTWLAPGQRWASDVDPGQFIVVEYPRGNRWVVRNESGAEHLTTGFEIRSRFHFAAD